MHKSINTYAELRKIIHKAGCIVVVQPLPEGPWVKIEKKDLLEQIKGQETTGQTEFRDYDGNPMPWAYDCAENIIYVDMSF